MSPASFHLPCELWFSIFELATTVPSALETTDAALIAFSRDEHGITTLNNFRVAQNTTLALSRVSFSFNRLVTPLLWRYIRIEGGHQVMQLASVLNGVCTKGKNPGAWCIRFEMALSGLHLWTDEHTRALERILLRLESLTVLSTVFCTTDPRLFSGALTRLGHLSGNIKRLELKADHALVHDIAQPLAQSLTALWVIPSRRSWATTHNLHLPNLSLFISSFLVFQKFHDFSSMPRLLTRIVEYYHDQDAFMKQYGPQLSCALVSSLRYVRDCLSSCPNLTEIIISFDHSLDIELPLFAGVHHHHLKTITILCPTLLKPGTYTCGIPNEDLDSSVRLRLDEIISLHTFPALQRVQFTLPVPRHDLVHMLRQEIPSGILDVWETWLLRCQAQEIAVLASEGVSEWVKDSWHPLTMDIVREQLGVF